MNGHKARLFRKLFADGGMSGGDNLPLTHIFFCTSHQFMGTKKSMKIHFGEKHNGYIPM